MFKHRKQNWLLETEICLLGHLGAVPWPPRRALHAGNCSSIPLRASSPSPPEFESPKRLTGGARGGVGGVNSPLAPPPGLGSRAVLPVASARPGGGVASALGWRQLKPWRLQDPTCATWSRPEPAVERGAGPGGGWRPARRGRGRPLAPSSSACRGRSRSS